MPISIGCFDHTFNYLPLPHIFHTQWSRAFYLLNRCNLIRKHQYLERSLKLISKVGFDSVQIMCQDPKQMPLGGRNLDDLCDDLNLKISSIGGYIDVLDDDRLNFKEIVDYTRKISTNIICVHSGVPKQNRNNWKIFKKRFIDLVDCASLYNIKIALENSPFNLVKTEKDLTDAIKSVPGLFINLDFGNLNLVQDKIPAAIIKLKKYIIHVHAKDSINLGGKFYFPSIGEGTVPFPKCIEALKKIKYKGHLIVEYEGYKNPLKSVTKSKKKIEDIIYKKVVFTNNYLKKMCG